MSKMRKLLESLDDIVDGEAIGADEQPVKKPKAKFLGNPHRANDAPVVEDDDEEDEEDLTEAMKAQFEDYVKNKAVPDSKKELKLEKQGDGSYQVKNEKGSVVCRGTKTDCQTHITKKNAELNDAKLDEGVSLKQKYEDKKRADKDAVQYGRMTQAEFDKKWSRTERPKPVKEAKWRADDLEDVTWTRDLDTGERHPIGDNSGYPGDELTGRPGSWRGKADMAKRMTKKGVPTKHEIGMQNNLKMRIKMDNKAGGLTGPKGKLPESALTSKTDKMAKLRSILDKLSDELKNTRKQIGSSKKVTEAPIDQQVPTAAGTTVQAAPGVAQAANQAQQAPANQQQGAVPANQTQQQPKPAPGQPQTTAQQAPAQPGQKTVAPAPGQPTPPVAGQAGGAPVAQPPGTPTPPQGSAVNASTTPAEQVKGLVQTLASNPAAAKQLGTKLNTVMK